MTGGTETETADTGAARRVRLTRDGIEVRGADALVRVVHRRGARHLGDRRAIVSLAGVAVMGLAALAAQLLWSRSPVVDDVSATTMALVLLVMELVATLLHETAHALVIVHHGRSVGRVGFGFYWGAPTFYVDASEALLLPRRARLVQSAAGPAADVVLAGVAALASLAFDGPAGSILLLFAVFQWLNVLTNLVPFLELDGYWMLADHLDRPGLRSESLVAARRMVVGPRRHITRLGIYGVSSTMFGVVLLAVGFVVWWAVVGDVLRTLVTEGFVGWLLVLPLALPRLVAWLTLVGQAIASVTRRDPGAE